MQEKISNRASAASRRERRYTVRYPFAADVAILEMESGVRSAGVTSDLSLGGCFICSSRPLPLNTRLRIQMSRRDLTVDALAVVRVFKPRIGMGVEFIDVEQPGGDILSRWIEQLRRERR